MFKIFKKFKTLKTLILLGFEEQLKKSLKSVENRNMQYWGTKANERDFSSPIFFSVKSRLPRH